MDKLNDLDMEKLKADLMFDNIDLLMKENFKETPGILEIFQLGRVIGRIDILRKMQVISDACSEDAMEFAKDMDEFAEMLNRKTDGEDDE